VAAIHAGWRGLAAGVIENMTALVSSGGKNLSAWIGPASPASFYYIGDEIIAEFPEKRDLH
jgi:hypothetical protein